MRERNCQPQPTEARIPFETVHERLLDPAHLGAFKTLILPNIAALSEAHCRQIRDFAAQGGSVVANYQECSM